ncbi:7,8-didemethyl-8-hydroxy-5-deazariboflavin synthase subunit CofG [Methanobrevibacter filiformis]|uniref:7,8-didemethyl-8-hydroxy-5-deazariboflavin synthase n=1 Tax=Methanobrevibacter filiformis TaxID=55758 RepID=A0A162FIV7_9EURY|nr:7,8-didemethyl-8-hydroxy-5-deazariboflavin synthase subunit CofG [Methanobrevibacter filiformis]KZX13695.1 FO synthase subunit 1 [Methanobrevibacter filiformis]
MNQTYIFEKTNKRGLNEDDVVNLLNSKREEVNQLMEIANHKRESNIITYSKNMFIPVTEICRNACGYCIFKKSPANPDAIILKDKKDIIVKLKESEKYGCKEALLTFGEEADSDKVVQKELKKKGYVSIVEYVYDICENILNETELLPHTNGGVFEYEDLKALHEVNVSMGMMIENSSERLMHTIAHENSPGKDPGLRLEAIANAGKLKIPYTTGILIGIGETKEEIAKSLMDIQKLQNKYGHIQELIVQNFRSKKGTPMENYPEPSLLDMIRTVSVSKLLFNDLSIQVPPNLNYETNQVFLLCGGDDWGGISPLTKDYVNPEASWPQIKQLKLLTNECGYEFKERLAIYDKYINSNYLNDNLLNKTLKMRNKLR